VASSADAILTKTPEGVITSWNPAAEAMYGWSAEEAIGRPITVIIPPHRHGDERQILGRITAGERIEHYQTERVRRDGRTIDVSLTISPVRDPDYTDGVPDALGTHGRFGHERLAAVLSLCAGLPPAQLVERIDRAVSGYRVGDPNDDSAIVAFGLCPDGD
jgi:PAS domain S-box-containing protein